MDRIRMPRWLWSLTLVCLLQKHCVSAYAPWFRTCEPPRSRTHFGRHSVREGETADSIWSQGTGIFASQMNIEKSLLDLDSLNKSANVWMEKDKKKEVVRKQKLKEEYPDDEDDEEEPEEEEAADPDMIHHMGIREVLDGETESIQRLYNDSGSKQQGEVSLLIWPWMTGDASWQFVMMASAGRFEILKANSSILAAIKAGQKPEEADPEEDKAKDAEEEDDDGDTGHYGMPERCQGRRLHTVTMIDSHLVPPVLWHGPAPSSASPVVFTLGVSAGSAVSVFELGLPHKPPEPEKPAKEDEDEEEESEGGGEEM